MGFLGNLFRRAASAGTPGETARTVGGQYLALKAQNPEASDEEIFQTILAARHASLPYTPQQLARLESYTPSSMANTIRWKLAEFVTELVLVESNVSAREIQGAPLQSIIHSVNDELRKLGLE